MPKDYASMEELSVKDIQGLLIGEYIRKVVDSVDVPVIANGDVVDSKSAAKCLENQRFWINDWQRSD